MSRLPLVPLLLALARGARIQSRRSLPDERSSAHVQPCDSSTLPARNRSSWCEQFSDQHITLERIRKGEGVCLDGQCYDARSLRVWLGQSQTLPHNRAPFTVETLNSLLGIFPPLVSQSDFSLQLSATGLLFTVAFGPDDMVLTGADQGVVQLWNARSGAELGRFRGHTETINSVQFAPDGRRFLTASVDRTIRLWDIDTGVEIRRFEGHSSAVVAAVFSPSGRTVLSDSYDGTVRIWDVDNGTTLHRLDSDLSVVSVAFRPPCASEVFVGVRGGAARRWDLVTGEVMEQGRQRDVYFENYSPDGTRLLLFTLAHAVKIVDAGTGEELMSLSGHRSFVLSGVFSPDGRRVLTGSSDFTARLWDADSGAELQRFTYNIKNIVFSVAFSPDGQKVVVSNGRNCNIFIVLV